MERNGELVAGLFGILGTEEAGGTYCVCNAKGLLQGATVVGALLWRLPTGPAKAPWMPYERW